MSLTHIVPAEQLAAALAELPEGFTVQPNMLRNLVVYDLGGIWAGYIDLGEDCNVVMYEEDQA